MSWSARVHPFLLPLLSLCSLLRHRSWPPPPPQVLLPGALGYMMPLAYLGYYFLRGFVVTL